MTLGYMSLTGVRDSYLTVLNTSLGGFFDHAFKDYEKRENYTNDEVGSRIGRSIVA